ncbi:putative gamma-secretase subunit PEN-2 [Trifolium repens]|nr:putative gamma-secretase subunit PEN-2 [Trifolium repens]
MEASQSQNNNNPNSNPNPLASSVPLWPTIDGPLGLSEEESVKYARRFYKFGFALLPLLWAVNCFYFWPVIRHSHSFPRIRPYVVGSAIGFTIFAAILCSWALTFSIGGERLFGPVWDELVMYNLADSGFDCGAMFSRGWFLVSLLFFGAGVDIIMYCLAFRFIVSFLPDFAYLAMEEKLMIKCCKTIK